MPLEKIATQKELEHKLIDLYGMEGVKVMSPITEIGTLVKHYYTTIGIGGSKHVATWNLTENHGWVCSENK